MCIASLFAGMPMAALAAESTAAPTPTSVPHEPSRGLDLTSGDAWFGLAAVAGVAATTALDRHVAREAPRADSRTARDFAAAIRRLGDPVVIGPALVVAWGAGKVFDDEPLASASFRIGCSVVAAGVVAEGLKQVVGRARPEQSPDDPGKLDPFSGDESFPSGHTTVAFATAAALDRECSARWVPWVAYPAAAAVGWSRLRDNKHWASDVVAGAAIGGWVSSKTDGFLRARAARAGTRVGLLVVPGDRGPWLGARLRF